MMRTLSGVRAELGEGPVWDPGRRGFWMVDIMRHRLFLIDPMTGRETRYEIDQPVGAVALTTDDDLVLAVRDGFGRMDPRSGKFRMWIDIEKDKPNNRMNDGYVDARGRFWAGTMSMVKERNQGALYCLAPDGSVTRHLTGVTTSNGIDWSTDNKRMYYIDSGEGRIDVFDYNLDRGVLSNRRVLATVDPAAGKPDGLVVDSDDHIWVALWRGGQVRRYTPDGQLVHSLMVPTPLTTKPAFVGMDMDELVITTAFIDLSEEERQASPDAGAVFAVRPGSRGRLPRRFGYPPEY